LFGVLFPQQIREDLVRAATSPWAKEQKEAFEALKKALASAETLAYYDKDAKTS